MSVNKGKSKEALSAELEHCEHIAKEYFGIDLNLRTLKGQVEGMIADKISEYFFQRFRDWSVHDLANMVDLLGERTGKGEGDALTAKQAIKAAKRANLV